MENQDIFDTQKQINNNEYEIRKRKALQLKEKKIDPWPQLKRNYVSIEIIKSYDISPVTPFQIIGRIIGKREHGKSIFITLQDNDHEMQGYIKLTDENTALFDLIEKYLDIGDFIAIYGELFLTKTNEKTIRIEEATLLSKCLHVIPEKHTGFENIELRYRQRYLDLLVNENVKEIFKKRNILIKHIRHYLDTNDYLEVETPMLHPIAGGAAARPFVTHHNALNSEFFLRIAPELYLKRLIIGGLPRVYEINKNFRNEGVSIRHNPEFTMLEFYTAFQEYTWAMKFVEDLLRSSCLVLNGSYKTTWQEHHIDFTNAFDRLTPLEAILKYTQYTATQLSEENIDQLLTEKKDIQSLSYQQKLFILFEEHAEKKLINPTFLIDFPIELSPLTKKDSLRPHIAPRFELFICGMEISNGYNELNDPFDQAERFKDQLKEKDAGNEEAMYYDQEFITALEYAMPPTVGVGIGIDRLAMILTGAKSIKDVILFPTMKKI